MNLSDKRFLEVFKGRPEAMLIVDPKNGLIIKANVSASAFFGIPKDEIEILTLDEINIIREQEIDSGSLSGASHESQVYKYKEIPGRKSDVIIRSYPLIYNNELVVCLTVERAVNEVPETDVKPPPMDNYENFFRHSIAGKALLNLTFGFIEVNEEFCRIMGYSESELLKMKFVDITHPEDIDKGMKLTEEVKMSGSFYGSQEKRYIHKDGHVIYASIRLSVIRDISGNPVNFVAQVQDNTDRKNLELLLSGSENLYKTVVLSVKEALILQERSGKIIIWNEGAEKLFGIKQKEAVGLNTLKKEWLTFKPDGTRWPPDDHPSMITFKTGKPCRGVLMKIQFTDTDPFRWISVDTSPICKPGESLPYAVIIAAFDITEKIKIDELFKSRLKLLEDYENKAKENLLIMTLDEAEKLTDSEIGFFHFVNEDENSLFLQQWSTNTKKTMCKAVPYESHYPLENAGVWADCMRLNKPVIHNDFRNLQGKKGYPEGHAEVIRELTVPVKRGGKTVAIIGVGNKKTDYNDSDVESVTQIADLAWDIIQKKHSDENLKISEYNLRKSNEEKDKLFSIIAHDLRSPFTSFMGLTEMIAENIRSMNTSDVVKFVQKINSDAHNLFSLLNNLLEWSLNQRGLGKFVQKVYQLNTIVDEALMAFGENISRKEIKLYKEIKNDVTIYADKHMLQTIIRNLISNAVKFNRRGGEIRIYAGSDSSNRTEIMFEDNGIGMCKDILDNLFDISVITKRKGTEGEPSTGLGLQLCKEFVEKNGGTIKIESEVEKGTRILVSLPSENHT